MSAWHLMVGGQPQGPFSEDQLKARAGGDLTAASLVWREGLAEWAPAGSLPELQALLRASEARPAQVSAAPRPAARAASTPAPASRAAADGHEEPTLNPLKLALRSFRWRGRFDRGQFAMVWFGLAFLNGLLLGLVLLALMLIGRAAGPRGVAAALFAFWAIVALDLVVALLINLGALVRRLNDLGRPSFWVVGAFVPFVNLALIVYLLVAPGDPAARLPESFRGAVLALAGLFGLALLTGGLFFTLFVLPGLKRARTAANEASAQGDLRAVASAQMAYSFSNGNVYEGRFECLHKPSSCIPGYSGPSFLDASSGEQEKAGYLRRLHAGDPLGAALPNGASPSSTATFAVVAWPVTPGTTGLRSFCIDAGGVLCSATDVPPDALVARANGQVTCSPACQPLF